MSQDKIKTFKDIMAWKMGRDLTIQIYRVTAYFPQSEQFGLTNQIRRAAISITSNIAEGFGRRTGPDRIRFYEIARGSANEVLSQLDLAEAIGMLRKEHYEELEVTAVDVCRILTGLINKTKELNHDS